MKDDINSFELTRDNTYYCMLADHRSVEEQSAAEPLVTIVLIGTV